MDESKGRSPYITVTFRTADGRDVEGDTSNYTEPADPGDVITVVYDPQDPNTFQDERWGTGSGSFGLTIFLMLVGISFVYGGVYTARRGVPEWLRRD